MWSSILSGLLCCVLFDRSSNASLRVDGISNSSSSAQPKKKRGKRELTKLGADRFVAPVQSVGHALDSERHNQVVAPKEMMVKKKKKAAETPAGVLGRKIKDKKIEARASMAAC
jgi:hypothetical protein